MRVLSVSKEKKVFDELQKKIGSCCSLRLVAKDTILQEIEKEPVDVVFFTNLKPSFKTIQQIIKLAPNTTIVYNAMCVTPEMMAQKGCISANLMGMNLLPTFIDRSLAEVNCLKENNNFEAIEKLGFTIQKVKNRVGMVTPRVILMIINEAYYTLQEGTANKEDIDTGMKLGTNYPKGPFEWATAIGLKNIYTVLDALFNDTKEGRYKICPLLKTEMLAESVE